MFSIKKTLFLIALVTIACGMGFWLSLPNEVKVDEPKRVEISLLEPTGTDEIYQLAETQRLLKHYDQAIKWYKIHQEKNGSREESWHSKYMLARCYEELNDWENALHWYLEAYQSNPERAETLYEIAKHYRMKGENHLAVLYAKQASTIPLPDKHHCQHINNDIYERLIDEELSIASFYTPFKNDGYDAANRILLTKGLPKELRKQAHRNIMYYTPRLPNTTITPFKIETPLLRSDSDLRYNQMNASIRKSADGYEMIHRLVNYTNKGTRFEFVDPQSDRVWRTKNFFIQLDKNFQVKSKKEVIENLNRHRVRGLRAEGIEDCRLFYFNNQRWFTCSTVDTNPIEPSHQVALCKLEDDLSKETVHVEKMVILEGPDQRKIQKNWLPFLKDNELYLVFTYEPFTVIKPNLDTGAVEKYFKNECSLDLTLLRGSAPPIEFEDGYLILVHDVAIDPIYPDMWTNNYCYYFHRFLFMDKNFEITKYTKPFIFQHHGIEYCSGMTIDHTGTKLVMPISKEDREAFLLTVDVETVKSLLEVIP